MNMKRARLGELLNLFADCSPRVEQPHQDFPPVYSPVGKAARVSVLEFGFPVCTLPRAVSESKQLKNRDTVSKIIARVPFMLKVWL